MSDFFTNFNAEDAKNVPSFELLPVGDYIVTFSKVEERTSKAGDIYVSIMLDVIDGQYKGRKLFHTINLNHSKKEVRDIAKAEFTNIYVLTGNIRPRSYSELIGKVLKAHVKINPAKDGYEASNAIKGWNKATPEAPIPVVLGTPAKPEWA